MMNKGPSRISLSEMFVTWQKATEDQQLHFMYLMERPYVEGPVKCHVEHGLINPLNVSVRKIIRNISDINIQWIFRGNVVTKARTRRDQGEDKARTRQGQGVTKT